jgi:hypothetical protein
LKKQIKKILSIMLSDNVKAQKQDEHSNHHYVDRREGEEEIDSQLVLYSMAYNVREDEKIRKPKVSMGFFVFDKKRIMMKLSIKFYRQPSPSLTMNVSAHRPACKGAFLMN